MDDNDRIYICIYIDMIPSPCINVHKLFCYVKNQFILILPLPVYLYVYVCRIYIYSFEIKNKKIKKYINK